MGTRRRQHDDHCWLTARGQAWAIRRIAHGSLATRFYLWRGREPHIEYAQVDMSDEALLRYADKAASWLKPGLLVR